MAAWRSPKVDVMLSVWERRSMSMQNLHGVVSASASGLSQYVSSGTAVADTTVQRLLNLFGLRGKAFSSAFWISLPAALIALAVRLLANQGVMPYYDSLEEDALVIDTAVWTGITGALGFLIVFRASQAYGRYWQALTSVHFMQAEWFDACSSLVSFCSNAHDQDMQTKVIRLKNVMVRLFSLLHAAALLSLIEPGAADKLVGEIALLDPEGLDSASIQVFEKATHRVELISHWIQNCIMAALEDGSLSAPSPILSRTFQELAHGLVKYHDALKVKTICFPKQYQAVCDVLLVIHWVITPFLVSLWVNSSVWAFAFTFFGTFTLWSLSGVSATIEVPFALADFVADAKTLQDRFNGQLRCVMHPSTACIPQLAQCSATQSNDDLLSAFMRSVPIKLLAARANLPELLSSAEAGPADRDTEDLVSRSPSAQSRREIPAESPVLRSPLGSPQSPAAPSPLRSPRRPVQQQYMDSAQLEHRLHVLARVVERGLQDPEVANEGGSFSSAHAGEPHVRSGSADAEDNSLQERAHCEIEIQQNVLSAPSWVAGGISRAVRHEGRTYL